MKHLTQGRALTKKFPLNLKVNQIITPVACKKKGLRKATRRKSLFRTREAISIIASSILTIIFLPLLLLIELDVYLEDIMSGTEDLPFNKKIIGDRT